MGDWATDLMPKKRKRQKAFNMEIPNHPELSRVILDELARANRKFPHWPTDPHHALAVLGEEFGELQQAVLQFTYDREKSSIRDVETEAIQTAAMALRFLLGLPHYRFNPSEQYDQADALR